MPSLPNVVGHLSARAPSAPSSRTRRVLRPTHAPATPSPSNQAVHRRPAPRAWPPHTTRFVTLLRRSGHGDAGSRNGANLCHNCRLRGGGTAASILAVAPPSRRLAPVAVGPLAGAGVATWQGGGEEGGGRWWRRGLGFRPCRPRVGDAGGCRPERNESIILKSRLGLFPPLGA